MLFKIAALAGLAGTAAALPHEARTYHSERIQANVSSPQLNSYSLYSVCLLTQVCPQWDDVPVIPLVPLTSPTGKYKKLDFTGFEVTPIGLNGYVLTGLETQSKPNAIASGLQAELLTGPATIKTTGEVKSFDLEQFYFGCALK